MRRELERPGGDLQPVAALPSAGAGNLPFAFQNSKRRGNLELRSADLPGQRPDALLEQLHLRENAPYIGKDRLRRMTAFDQTLLGEDVRMVEEQDRLRRLAVAPGPADLLVIGLHRFWN